MRTEKRDVFVADDGKVFETEAECQAHEREVAAQAKRIERLTVYVVTSGFDSTEGRGYHRTTYIVSDASFPVVLEYCFDRYGHPLSGWYGDGYYEQWIIRSTTMSADEAIKRSKESHTGVGLSNGAADLVFLSHKPIEHNDLPAPVFPWPKAKKAAS